MTDRARRSYLFATLLGPVVLVALAALVFAGVLGRGQQGAGWACLGLAVVFGGIAVLLRSRPRVWVKTALVFGVLSAAWAALVLLSSDRPGRMVLVVAVAVVLALVPVLAVRNIALAALPPGGGDFELVFPIRGEADGQLLVRRDEVAVRVRRKVRRNLDDNHDDTVLLGDIAEVEVVEVADGAEVPLGLSHTISATAGPAVRVRVVEEDVREDEWIVPADGAREAAEAIRARQNS